MTEKPKLYVTYPSDMWPQFNFEGDNVDVICHDGKITLRKYPTGIVVATEKCRITPMAGRECPWCELSVGKTRAHAKRRELIALLKTPIDKGEIGTHALRSLIDREYGGRDDDE